MPTAQGRITVRRKAKDGEPGADAVVYSFIPSTGSIVWQKDGSPRPSAVSARLVKHEGNQVVDITTNSFDGYQVCINVVMGSGEVYGGADYTPGEVLSLVGSQVFSALEFVLVRDGKTEAYASIPVVAEGADTTSYWLVPSVSSVVRQSNNGSSASPNPTAVSVSVKCQTGAAAPYDITAPEGVGLSVSYKYEHVSVLHILVTNNSLSAVDVPSDTSYTGITFYLHKDNVLIDSVTIPFVNEGKPGENSVRYWLNANASSIIKDSQGVFTPSSVFCKVMRQIGAGNPREVNTLFVRYKYTYSNDLMMLWRRYIPNTVLAPSSTVREILFELYLSGTDAESGAAGDGTCLDTVTIPVIYDGKDGAQGAQGVQGLQGCIYRRSKFATGFQYRNDAALETDGLRYIDLAYIMQDSSMFASRAKWFRCKKTHESTTDNAPKLTSDGTEAWLEYWEPLNTMEPIYTPLLLADDAVITLMQTNQILIGDDDENITAGFSGSNIGKKIRIWVGDDTPDDAPFRVDVTGALVSKKAEITGTINAISGRIAGFNIIGTSLTNGPDFDNDACVIFKNNSQKTYAAIGGNVLASETGARAVARFENHDDGDGYGSMINYGMLLSARGAYDNIALSINGGAVSGFALNTVIIGANVKSQTLGRHDTNVVAINENECVLTLPTMEWYDNGHIVRIKRLGKGVLKLKLGVCSMSQTTLKYALPCLIHDQDLTLTGLNTLEFISPCDAMELVWCRDLNRKVGNTIYYGCWLQYKLPRDW